MTSGCAHRFVLPVSAECGPVGSFSVKLDTGTSGTEAKLVVVIPRLMSVLPTRITRTPLPSSSRSRSGKAAPPWETRYAGPLSVPGRTGVVAVAVPTLAPAGQLKGFDAYVASGQACCSVVSREGSWTGSCVTTERMLAWRAGCVTLTCRLSPFARDGWALVEALNEGVNASAPQPLTAN